MISPDQIERVRERANIIDIIGESVKYISTGRQFFGLCPFHEEKTPSFAVNPTYQTYHCFGCGEGGNVYNFLMKQHALNFPQAVILLANKLNISLEFSEQERAYYQEKESIISILEKASVFYGQNLHKNERALDYLTKRGFENKTLKEFSIGYSLDSWDATLNHFLQLKYSPQTLEKSGLIIPKKNSSGYYDNFRGRIMFPIKDSIGRIVGFGARRIIEDPNHPSPKYLNSSESLVYKKSEILYLLPESVKTIQKKGKIILVEGYTDALLAHQHGINNVVATCGTALTDKHLEKIKNRFPDTELILCPDGDKAGTKSIISSAYMTLGRGNTFVAELPEGEDPASIILSKTAQALEKILNKKTPLFDFYIKEKGKNKNLDFAEGIISFLESIQDDFMKIPSEMQGVHLEILCRETKINPHYIKDVLFKRDFKTRENLTRNRWEYLLLRGLIEFPDFRPYFAKRITPNTFNSLENSIIYEHLLNQEPQENLFPLGTLFEGERDYIATELKEQHPCLDETKLKRLLESRKNSPPSLKMMEIYYMNILSQDIQEKISYASYRGISLTAIERILYQVDKEIK